MGETMQVSSVELAAFALLLSFAGALFAVFKAHTGAINSLRLETDAKIKAESEAVSKRAHDRANEFQILIAKMDVDMRRLERETVRREDMKSIEDRVTMAINKVEMNIEKIGDKLDGFIVKIKQRANATAED